MQYIRSLDGVRAIAILSVMLFHFHNIFGAGWIGVQLFFVLSGYLITTILIHQKELSFSLYLKRFYWRRILRIFPLYYGYIFLVAAIFLIAGIPDNFPNIIGFLLSYSYNLFPLFTPFELDQFFTHFWSLAIEEQFYLFWPFLIFLIPLRNLKFVLVLIIITGPLTRFILTDFLLQNPELSIHQVGETVYRFTFSQIDSLATGALIPILGVEQLKKHSNKLLLISSSLFILAGMLNFLSLENISITTLGYPIGGLENYQHIWSYSVINFFCFSFILFLVINHEKRHYKLLENKIMVSIGKISYGMYVYHWLVLAIMNKAFPIQAYPKILTFSVYLLIVFLISQLSFSLYEGRFLKLKDKKFKV